MLSSSLKEPEDLGAETQALPPTAHLQAGTNKTQSKYEVPSRTKGSILNLGSLGRGKQRTSPEIWTKRESQWGWAEGSGGFLLISLPGCPVFCPTGTPPANFVFLICDFLQATEWGWGSISRRPLWSPSPSCDPLQVSPVGAGPCLHLPSQLC